VVSHPGNYLIDPRSHHAAASKEFSALRKVRSHSAVINFLASRNIETPPFSSALDIFECKSTKSSVTDLGFYRISFFATNGQKIPKVTCSRKEASLFSTFLVGANILKSEANIFTINITSFIFI
jgi:hypothetical protein